MLSEKSDISESENELHETHVPLHFTIADLLRWTAICGGFFGLIHWFGVWGLLPASLLLVDFILLRNDLQLLFDLFLLLGSIFLLLAMLLPSVGSGPPGPRSSCANNLKQIAMALDLYHDTHGSYPPAYFTDDQGKPTHSWRAMILTELGRPDLAAAYRWDEPWDGPNNRLLHGEKVHILRCPSEANPRRHETSYVAVIGPGTVFPGATSVSASQITDRPNETLLLVEMRDSGIGWFEPRDLDVSQLTSGINSKHRNGPSSNHPKGANVAFADGTVRFLTNRLPAKQLRAMSTIAGREAVELP